MAELRAQLAAKDAELAARDAQLAAKDARIEELEQLVAKLTEQVAALTKQVEEFTEKLGRNSSNSNKPPSSDPPGRAGRGGKRKKSKKSKRKRGGQPGHRGSHRELVPEDQVDEVHDRFPDKCGNCWESLPQVFDPNAKRYQVTEVPPIRPHTTEFRCHTVGCKNCGYKTRARHDEQVIPSSSFGPRLMSLLAVLVGVYHLSRRRTVTLLRDMVGVRISLGSISAIEARVSEAIKSVFDEVCDHVEGAAVKHTDGTGWLKTGLTMSLWTVATKAATVYKIVANGKRATLEPLFGKLEGILISDRATVLGFWAMERRQICWAHLLRKFVSFSERDGPAGRFGRDLLDYTGILFEYWHDYKAGKLDRRKFRLWMTPVRAQMEALLVRAREADIKGLSGSCANILDHKNALWTFLERDGVEPTNNHAYAARSISMVMPRSELCRFNTVFARNVGGDSNLDRFGVGIVRGSGGTREAGLTAGTAPAWRRRDRRDQGLVPSGACRHGDRSASSRSTRVPARVRSRSDRLRGAGVSSPLCGVACAG